MRVSSASQPPFDQGELVSIFVEHDADLCSARSAKLRSRFGRRQFDGVLNPVWANSLVANFFKGCVPSGKVGLAHQSSRLQFGMAELRPDVCEALHTALGLAGEAEALPSVVVWSGGAFSFITGS